MSEQSGSMDRCGDYGPRTGYSPLGGRFMPFIIPLAIGFMLGMRKAIMHRGMGPYRNWENGIPPFFAEMHRRAHAAENQPPAEAEA